MPKRKSCAYGHAIKMRLKRRKMTKNVQTRSSHVPNKAPSSVNIKRPSNSNGFTTRCRPNGLVNVINNLNPNQKQAVQDIGFGGLLEVKVSYIPQDILPWILSAFNWVSYKFMAAPSKEFSLSALDVHDIFGLPRSDRKVEVIPMGQFKLFAHELKTVWRKKFGMTRKKCIPLSKLASMLVNCNESGDEFKRLFVLYSMSSFLAPTTNHSVDLKLLKAVDDVDEIKQLDWCSYVFQELVKGVKAYQEGKPYICGCVLLLMLAYFHRIEFNGEPEEVTLPLIKHWDADKLLQRVKGELQSGSLGNGALTRVSYPISGRSSPSEGDDRHPPACSTKRFIEIELPVGVDTDEEIHAKSLNDVDKLVFLMKRDSDLFYQRYLDRVAQIKSKTSDPALCKLVDDFINKAREVKTTVDNLASLEMFAHMLGKESSREKGLERDVQEEERDNSVERDPSFSQFLRKDKNDEGLNETIHCPPQNVHADCSDDVQLDDIADERITIITMDFNKGGGCGREERKDNSCNSALPEVVDDPVNNSKAIKKASNNVPSFEPRSQLSRKGKGQRKGPKGGGESNDQNISDLNDTNSKADVGINEQIAGCSINSNGDNSSFQMSQPLEFAISSKRKLLVLDICGLLADIVVDKRSVPDTFKPDFTLKRKKVFKRPFCDEFLQFCFEKFDVGIWSSEATDTLNTVVDVLMKNTKNKLLFCWDHCHCSLTTVENTEKPLFLKELKRVWEKEESDLPWKKGFYDKSNTILLDNSPYTAMRNPPYVAVNPPTYSFKNVEDKSLGPDGDLRLYLERLSGAKNVQKFIKANPFGQRPIQKLTRSVTKRMRNH